MTRIMLEAFVSKSILHVYQITRCNQKKLPSKYTKIYQNIPKNSTFSCLKQPLRMCFYLEIVFLHTQSKTHKAIIVR
jgi:hypothetical protein